jgi:tRNA nucleotidyltransferase (CCA-adding enzyme)
MTTIDPLVLHLCEAIRAAGGRALLVGGWVRDHLRGVPNVDYDLEVYALEPARLRALLAAHGTVNAVGEAFTVYKVKLTDVAQTVSLRSSAATILPENNPANEASQTNRLRYITIDVSLPRRESKVGRGHRGFEITGDPWMPVEEAARRRDFTINAVMYDPLRDETIDPFDGQQDLQARLIRAVDPTTFVEDSLRVLRAMQFAARFAFAIDPATVLLCRGIDLSDLPAERIWAEVEKWLLQSNKPSIGFWAAIELGITEKLWPEMHALIGCPQEYEWHPEGDVDIHTALVLDEARKLIDDLPRAKKLAVMLGALCHDFGKPATTKFEDGRLRSKGHEDAGLAPTEAFLDRLKLHTIDGYDVRQQVLALVADHLAPGHFHKSFLKGENVSDGAFRRLAQRVEPDLLYRVARADCLGRTGDFKPDAMEWFIARVNELAISVKAPEPILLGRHVLALGLQPGPEVGRITKAVYELQLDGQVTSLDEAIAAAQRWLEVRS